MVTRSSDVTHVPGGTHMIGAEGRRRARRRPARIAKVARASTGARGRARRPTWWPTPRRWPLLLEHPARDTGALVTADGDAPGRCARRSRVEGGRVVAAGTSFHDVAEANGTFSGVLQVGVADLAALAETAEELAELAETGGLGPMGDAEAVDLLLVGLVRSGVPVRAAGLGRAALRPGGRPGAADTAVGGWPRSTRPGPPGRRGQVQRRLLHHLLRLAPGPRHLVRPAARCS